MPPIYRRMILLALRRPWLVPALIGTAWAFRARNWYRRFPFLPVPPVDYMRWRMETAYGDPDAEPSYPEIARFVTWAARMRRGL